MLAMWVSGRVVPVAGQDAAGFTVGTPRAGVAGIRETSREIMERERQTAAKQRTPRQIRLKPGHEITTLDLTFRTLLCHLNAVSKAQRRPLVAAGQALRALVRGWLGHVDTVQVAAGFLGQLQVV